MRFAAVSRSSTRMGECHEDLDRAARNSQGAGNKQARRQVSSVVTAQNRSEWRRKHVRQQARHRDRPARRARMYDLGRDRRYLDAQRVRAEILAAPRHRNGASGRKSRHGLQLPADFGQPCRFQQAGQSRRPRDLEGSDRQGEWASSQARLHDPHRRYHPSLETRASRRCGESHGRGEARCSLRAGRARRHRRGKRQGLSNPGQFDDAEKVIGEAKLDVHYVPGEHDVIDEENGKAYLERYGKNTKGTGWYSFDAGGVHFIGLVNVANLKAGGMGSLGDEQLAWLAGDLKGKPASTPIVVFAHIPLWPVYPEWGWGTDDSARALALLKRFGSVTVLNGHIHQKWEAL